LFNPGRRYAKASKFPQSQEGALMNLSISGHHLSVTPSIREYVLLKLERIRRHFDQVIDVNVVLAVDKLIQKAEITIHVKGKELFAKATDSDMYAAIDALIDKLDRQVAKYKTRRKGFTHDAIKHQALDAAVEEAEKD
jgi:putative sigma-54 modulation protein